jgi:signal transduction histidine kinase
LTILSAVGLSVGLAIGGALILGLLHYVLIRSVDSSLRQTATDYAPLVTTDQSDEQIPSAGTSIIQIISPQGHVWHASVGADENVPIISGAALKRAESGKVVIIHGEDGERRVIAKAVTVVDQDHDGDGGPGFIVVAGSTHAAEESTETVTSFLLVLYPLLVILLSALAWRVVGWTLRPVEALRRSADQISAGGAGIATLPVPDGDDEVHRLAVTLNDMLERLDAGRARQRAFVADAAHELRSPITSLRTQLEVAAHMDEPALTADLLTDTIRLGRLVDDLLLLARADEGDPKLRPAEAVEVTELAGAAVDAYANARVPVMLTAQAPAWTVGEPVALRRILDNLITNAARHASGGVSVTVTAQDDVVRLTVSDDGAGIPAEDRERVFDRFTRLDNARDRDQGGAGLGLPIVRELVRMHHGTIVLGDAEPGLWVEIELPLMPSDAHLLGAELLG